MTAAAGAARPRLRRDRERGWLAGVAAGIAGRFGLDPVLVRLAFVVATAAGGAGVAIYALAWLVVPAGDSAPRERAHSPRGRAAVEVALGTGCCSSACCSPSAGSGSGSRTWSSGRWC